MFSFGEFIQGANALGTTALGFVAEGNRNVESLRRIQAERDVLLARQGFTAGEAQPAFRFLPASEFPAPPSSGLGLDLGSLTPWIPVLVAGLVVVAVLKR